jgi:hypothetical protein
MAVIAQAEAKAISERTKAAMAAAKARGRSFGNPNGAEPLRRANKGNSASLKAICERANAHAYDMADVLKDLEANGIASFAGQARELNRLGFQTPQNKRWHGASVARLHARLRNMS